MESLRQLAPGQVRFRIHGPNAEREELISGSLFANKLAVLVRALKEADRQINGEAVHDYKIARLESSDPTVTLMEARRPQFEDAIIARPGITGFDDCVGAILEGDRERALKYGKCSTYVHQMAGGAQKTYGYGEIWTKAGKREENLIRLDGFLGEQTTAVIHPEIVRPVDDGTDWYKGTVHASFDGAIKAVDLRGELPEIKLILTAGGKELDCVCRIEDKGVIRDSLDSRVRVNGHAYYDGKSGLPRRVEVYGIEPMTGDVDFSRWRGAFEPFDVPDWDTEDP